MSSTMQRNDVALEPGATFEGRYEIVAKLAEGGFGMVHRARQLSTGQPVALKILRLPEHGDAAQTDARIARFLREAQLCAQLRHPNIVQIVDAGQTADGTLYIAFAFAPGDNLAALLAREGALAPPQARHLMLQVLDALACAHAGGVVHRDLKPSNIMVIATGARRNAVVLDLGIGAALDDERSAHATGSGSYGGLGTPGYGAPEQWRGAEPSPRADLFSWGLVLLECLTGEPVYRGTAAEILHRLLGPDPVPIPVGLERHPLGALIAGAVRKDASARDVTARGLFEALDACDLRGLSREAMLGAGGSPPAGASLALPIAAPGRAAAPGSPAPGGERRQLTALCGRVTVRAAAGTAAAAEASDGALHAALAACTEVGRRHGGCVAAVLGGDLLLYFGYPQAAEDDARRAARAALALAGAVDAERARLAARGLRIELSAGIHTGPVIDGNLGDVDGARLVTGETPRIAARIAALAAPGAVVVSAASQALLRAGFDLEPQAAAALEGIPPGMATFRLGAEHGGTARNPDAPDAPDAPISGRDRELGALMECWRRAREGAGQTSLVTGEPGIGKSRLARELRQRIAQDAHRFLTARCAPDTQHSALASVIDLLEHALGLDQASGPSDKIARLERELTGLGVPPTAAMPLFLPLFSLPVAAPYAPLDVSPPRHKALTLQAIASLLAAMANQRPVLLLVEDLHWADPTTMELLSQLVRAAPELPMCVVMTARPEFSPSFSATGVQVLPLGRLERPQTAEMISHLLVGEKPLPPTVIDYISERADGVPLFVEELFRMMLDTALVVERDDRYELTGPLSDAAIPGTLRALLTARLDRLSRARETARLAAALGREFSLDVLSAASPLGPAAVAEDVEQLMRAGLVQRTRRRREAVGVFKHALVRDAAYDSLPAGARQEVHARIAGTLEARFPELVQTRPDLLAHHHAAAEQYAQALGYAQRAAMGALGRSGSAEAIGHARGALAWLPAIADDKQRARLEFGLQSALTPALMATQGYGSAEVAAAAARSLALIDFLGDSAETAPSLWALTAYHHSVSHRAQARALAQRMVDAAERERAAGLLPIALTTLGNCLWVEGELEPARDALTRALAEYQPQAHSPLALAFGLDARVWACGSLGAILWALGQPSAALARAREGVAWGRELKHANSICLAHLYLATVHYYDGDREGTLDNAERLLAFAHQHGLPFYDAFAHTYRGWVRREVEQARTLLGQLEQAGQLIGMTFYPAVVAEARAALGQVDDALAIIAACLALAADKHEHYNLPVLHRLQGEYALLRDPGATELAAACFDRAMSAARAQGARMFELTAARAAARSLAARGQTRAAHELLSAQIARFPEGETPSVLDETRALVGSYATR